METYSTNYSYIALEVSKVLRHLLSLLLTFVVSFKGYFLYPISIFSFILVRLPQFRNYLYYYPFHFYK